MNAQSIQAIQVLQANEDDMYNSDYLVTVIEGCTIYYELEDLTLDLED